MEKKPVLKRGCLSCWEQSRQLAKNQSDVKKITPELKIHVEPRWNPVRIIL